MKVILLNFILVLAFLWAVPALASSEQIDNYQVEIQILKNSEIQVQEIIDYNFGPNLKHGIYRDIPITAKSLREQPFKIYDVAVTNEEGEAYNFETSRQGSNFNIKIGSENFQVSGSKTYVIDYKVQGAFSFTDNSDNFFWNAIGTGWDIPILKNNIKVLFPEVLSASQIDSNCVWGGVMSQNKCPQISQLSNESGNLDGLVFKTGSLASRQGVTINLYFDKGIIDQVEPRNIVWAFLQRYGIIFLPIIVFAIMFYLWHRKGRDPKGRGTIIVQYDPPAGMMPAEVGTIYDERVHSKDISAEIIYLAIGGYLKIKRLEKTGPFSKEDYILEKLKGPEGLTRQYQKDLMNELFSASNTKGEVNDSTVKLSVLKKRQAYQWMKKIEDSIYNLITEQGYFTANPQKTRRIYTVIWILILGVIQILAERIFSLFSQDYVFLFLSIFSVLICGLIIFFFGYIMPKKTTQGVLAKEYILGLKEYINVAEKERIKFHNEPAKDPQVFEKLLPYAMALGLEEAWAKQFEGIYISEPTWYDSGQGANFSAIGFGASLHSFQSTTSSMTSSSSASGGGGVGGGGGGGGGGSW